MSEPKSPRRVIASRSYQRRGNPRLTERTYIANSTIPARHYEPLLSAAWQSPTYRANYRVSAPTARHCEPLLSAVWQSPTYRATMQNYFYSLIKSSCKSFHPGFNSFINFIFLFLFVALILFSTAIASSICG